MILSEDDSRSTLENYWFTHFASINIAERVRTRNHLHYSIIILKHTMFIGDVGTNQLNILRNVGFWRSYFCCSNLATENILICCWYVRTYLDVVEETLRERRIRIEIDKVRSLLGLEESDSFTILLQRHAHLSEHRLSLMSDSLGPLELGLPGLSELRNQLLILLQLINSLLGDGGAGSSASLNLGISRNLSSKFTGRS